MKRFPFFLQKNVSSLLFLQIILLFFTLPHLSQAELVDKVVAVVNDDVITLSEVENEAKTLYQSIARNYEGPSLTEELEKARESTLDSMISRRLIDQKAALFNLKVSEKEIDNGYERMRKRSSLSPSEFRKKLAESGMSEEVYRTNIRSQILQSKLVSFDVRSKIVITDEMILDYYDENYTSRVKKGNYYLLQMGFTWNKESGSAEDLTLSKKSALKKAERVYKLVEKGEDFRTLAKKFSNLPSAIDGGDIGIFTLDEMAPAMRDAVANLKHGQLSKIVETPTEYQFYKLLSEKDGSIVITASYDTVKDEIKEKLYQVKLKEAFTGWVADLKEKAYIQKL